MARARILQDNLEVRMVLLGKTGVGKSSFANTILGEQKFKASASSKSITKTCAVGRRQFKDKTLIVLDTPGFFDTSLGNAEIQDEVAKLYQIMAPGPHAFLLILAVGARFTEEEQKAIEWVTTSFREGAMNYSFIVFTGLDKLTEGETIEDYLAELEPSDPRNKLLDQCGRRYIAVNNKGTDVEKEKTLGTLLNKIDEMVFKNGGRAYTTLELEKVDAANAALEAKGAYQPMNSDGSIILYDEPKQIVGSFLRRSVGTMQ